MSSDEEFARTIRKSNRLAKKRRKAQKDKEKARASIEHAVGAQSKRRATNLAEGHALARAEAAAANLDRGYNLRNKRTKRRSKTPKSSRSSRTMRAKVRRAFSSEGEGEDDNIPPPLHSPIETPQDRQRGWVQWLGRLRHGRGR